MDTTTRIVGKMPRVSGRGALVQPLAWVFAWALAAALAAILSLAVWTVASDGLGGRGPTAEQRLAAARGFAAALDREIATIGGTLRLLSRSPRLAADDLDGFRRDVAAMRTALHGAPVTLLDGARERPVDGLAPSDSLRMSALARRVIATSRRAVAVLPPDGDPVGLGIAVPVARGAGRLEVLATILGCGRLHELLAGPGLPPDTVAVVLLDGAVAALVRPAEGIADCAVAPGTMVPPAAGMPEAVPGITTIAGRAMRTVVAPAGSGLTVAVAAPEGRSRSGVLVVMLLGAVVALFPTTVLGCAVLLNRFRPLPDGAPDTANRAAPAAERAGVVAPAGPTGAEVAGTALARQNLGLPDTTPLSHLGHELRTPLTIIIGFSEAMLLETRGPLGDPKYREYCTAIGDSGRHLLALAEQILDHAAAAADRIVLREEVVDLAEEVAAAVGLFGAQAETLGLRLVLDVEGSERRLVADRMRLRQMLLNVLSNAVKFTPRGGTVTVTVPPPGERGFSFTVRDTGIGIAADDLGRVLRPFEQVHGVESHGLRGTGLGLPLVKRLAELHGGVLEMSSEPGVGTTVTIRFPRERTVRLCGDCRHAGRCDGLSAAERPCRADLPRLRTVMAGDDPAPIVS
ncbi:sensor histidine kinase [Rhodovulum sp. PH10]|uniref:sensor histidine kinase n=1 Tax=Rhodovulum sp. PH10 TaxID=1187851 RepID=UPI000590A25C|nr:HAMP domain-containing sensor histidine kinase [Rhodovulum sp. PH10]